MIIDEAMWARWNDAPRRRSLEVRGVDKVALALLLGVSVRTVQRWFTRGAQRRNLIPTEVIGQDFVFLPTAQLRLRVLLGALLAGDHTRFFGRVVDEAVVEFQWATLADALIFADALASGLGPVWLTCNWRLDTVARVGEAWVNTVRYEGERARKREGVQVAYGLPSPPPSGEEEGRRAGECEPGTDCPGDDLRRECCVLKTREECARG
jgi:hypothetical protein